MVRMSFHKKRELSARTVTDTVGIYSPGKALVVYEMRRHVCGNPLALLLVHTGKMASQVGTYLANSTITSHDTLREKGIRLVWLRRPRHESLLSHLERLDPWGSHLHSLE